MMHEFTAQQSIRQDCGKMKRRAHYGVPMVDREPVRQPGHTVGANNTPKISEFSCAFPDRNSLGRNKLNGTDVTVT
jgi:hypothetical protein